MHTTHGFTYLTRGLQRTAPDFGVNATLPPRELIEPYPEVVKVYDEYANLTAAVVAANASAGRHRQAATEAEQTYHRELREAMAAGQDTAGVKNRKAEHDEKAARADLEYREARSALQQLRPRLGAALASIAEQVIATSEADLTEAGEDVATARAALVEAEQRWRTAWGIRRAFGNLALFGGAFSGVAAGNVEDMGTALATLKAEEKALSDRFARDDHAQEVNDRVASVATP